MLEYIQFNNTSSILKQLPEPFESAAILLHPFVKMPDGWEDTKREYPYQIIYPSDEEILSFGTPVMWRTVMDKCQISTYEDMELALKTALGALGKEQAREDLKDQLNSIYRPNLYIPVEDSLPALLLKDILSVLGSKEAKTILFSEPIYHRNGKLVIQDTTPLEICNITDRELLLTDENNDFAFMSVYDSCFTLFLAKEKNISSIIESMNWEAILCNKDTFLDWFLPKSI
ncbi:DUF2711 family protein [Heyndrickxia acidicola]|uniref:DUF2711 family protein n=1 Tax=Heyndrickxia acidicola TaxID=209389 RepID=A0ABU6MEC6_9BACI|nr:DUF2711 family protein [Heyndrickxia acidicola]MED1203014.1 DUF2711 family protein [Heyndrickxia acidicola]